MSDNAKKSVKQDIARIQIDSTAKVNVANNIPFSSTITQTKARGPSVLNG